MRNMEINVLSAATPSGFKLSTFREILCLHYQVRRVMTLGATGYSETLVSFYQTIRHHIPKDCNLNIHCLENIKSQKKIKDTP
jgi:hypothetical protein